MDWSNALVVVATLLGWYSLVPQIRKLITTRDATGVSASWPAVGFVSNAAWTFYLLQAGLWPAAPSTAVMTLFYVLVMWALRETGRSLHRGALAGTTWAMTLIGVGMWGGWGTVGLVLGVSYAVQFAPALWSAYTVRRPTGISPGTWSLIGVEAALWGLYGVAQSDRPITIFGGTGIVAAAAILVRYALSSAGTSAAIGSRSSNRVVSNRRW